MVNIEQIQRGIERYIDAEFVTKSTGLSRWGIAAAGGILSGVAVKRIHQLIHLPELADMGIVDESGAIDIEQIYRKVRAAATTPVTQEIPLIGAVTFTVDDVDRLYNLIVSS